MHKKLSILMASILCLSVALTGCGSKTVEDKKSVDSSTTELGKFPLTNTKTTIKILVPWSGEDINKLWNTTEYEKKTNVHVEWSVVPSDGWKEKRAVILASGDLPDAIVSGPDVSNFSPIEQQQYGSQGVFLDLAPLIEKDSIYLKKEFNEKPQYKKLMTSTDGKIYGLGDINECYHCDFSQKMFINSVWLKKLNLKMPTTTDEFENVLKAFKTQDPNGNGKADEKPLVTSTDGWHNTLAGFLMSAFTYTDSDTNFELNNGKIEFTPTKQAYKDGLKYLNKLYKEGLIAPESFTQNATSLMKLNESGDVEVAGAVPTGANFAFSGGTAVSGRWADYDIVPPIAGPNGFKSSPNFQNFRDVTPGMFEITKAAKDPDLIMRWIDWMYSPEGTRFHNETGGRLGIDYREGQAGEVDFNGNPAKFKQTPISKTDPMFGKVTWGITFPALGDKASRETYAVPKDWRAAKTDPMAPEVQLFEGSKAYEAVAPKAENSMAPITVPADKIEDYSRLQTAINDYLKENIAKFIIGNVDIDKEWNNYTSEFDKIGLKDYLQMTQEAYDKQYKK